MVDVVCIPQTSPSRKVIRWSNLNCFHQNWDNPFYKVIYFQQYVLPECMSRLVTEDFLFFTMFLFSAIFLCQVSSLPIQIVLYFTLPQIYLQKRAGTCPTLLTYIFNIVVYLVIDRV